MVILDSQKEGSGVLVCLLGASGSLAFAGDFFVLICFHFPLSVAGYSVVRCIDIFLICPSARSDPVLLGVVFDQAALVRRSPKAQTKKNSVKRSG